MKLENLQTIRKSLESTYLLKSNDIDDLMSKFAKLKDKALDKILAILKQAQDYQNEFIKANIGKDPLFLKNMESLLKSSYQQIGKQVTKNEQNNADSLLDNL